MRTSTFLVGLSAICLLCVTFVSSQATAECERDCLETSATCINTCVAAGGNIWARESCDFACYDTQQSCMSNCTQLVFAASSSPAKMMRMRHAAVAAASMKRKITHQKKAAKAKTFMKDSIQCEQTCNTNGLNCATRCEVACSQLPGGSCQCAGNGPYSCSTQQDECIQACDE